MASAGHSQRPLVALRGGYSSVHGGGVGGGGGGERSIATGDDCATVGESGGAEGSTEGIDEDLYSRQLYVMGKSAMAKMGKADVLISGMR